MVAKGEKLHISTTWWANPTEKLFSQHIELVLVEAPNGVCAELPAENLGELSPRGSRRTAEVGQILREDANARELLDFDPIRTALDTKFLLPT